jgi:hypothetical protein
MSVGGLDRLENFGRGISKDGGGDPVFKGVFGKPSPIDQLHLKILGPSPGESEADRAIRMQQEDEARKQGLRDQIDAMFNSPGAAQQFSTEESDLSGALRQQYTDDLTKRGAAAERSMRFGAANTGNIGGTTFADATGKLQEENALGATRIEDAVRRAITGLRTAREDSRLRAIGLVNSGTGQDAVSSAASGLKLAADTAKSQGQEQIFNDLFGDLAYTKAAGDSNDKNAQIAAILQRNKGGSFFPTQPQTSGRIIQTN